MRLDAFAPAKVNLFLHVGGPDAEGYHPISSLMLFADVGDRVRLQAADAPSFETTGRFGARSRWATATWLCGPPTPCAFGWADRSRRSA